MKVEQNYISSVEAGKYDIQVSTLEKFCAALGLDIAFLTKVK
jgi:transcriptional regulator with XRE-family HTH domain